MVRNRWIIAFGITACGGKEPACSDGFTVGSDGNCYAVEDDALEGGMVSNRFRIELCGTQCMHVRAFELFGTILPGWSLD